MRRMIVMGALLALLAGCGEDEAAAPAAPPSSAGTAIRMAEFEADAAKCEAGEVILNAYCFVKPGGSVSASSVVFRQGDDGDIGAACLSGGKNIRLFCIGK